MNEEAFKQGFIKRAKEYGLSDKHADELIKEGIAPLLALAGTAARAAAPRMLPWLGRMLAGAGRWARGIWTGNVGTSAAPIYNLGANGAIKPGLKSMLMGPTARGIGYGMLGNEAINQFTAPQQEAAQPIQPQQANNWVNPFTSNLNRGSM